VFIRVVFPAPLGPIMAVTRPGWQEPETPFRTLAPFERSSSPSLSNVNSIIVSRLFRKDDKGSGHSSSSILLSDKVRGRSTPIMFSASSSTSSWSSERRCTLREGTLSSSLTTCLRCRSILKMRRPVRRFSRRWSRMLRKQVSETKNVNINPNDI